MRIFLWEKNTDAAWEEASTGGCDDGLWLELARLREMRHPGDAITVYQKLIDPIVRRTNNDAYREAAELIRHVKKLMTRTGEQARFREYMAGIRTEHKRKRNFMKLLEKLG